MKTKEHETTSNRRSVLMNFAPGSLERLDAWQAKNLPEETRTSFIKRCIELFMWLWDAKSKGATIYVKHKNGTVELLTRL